MLCKGIIFLAIGSTLSREIVELVSAAKRVLSSIYLGEALFQLILMPRWLLDIFWA